MSSSTICCISKYFISTTAPYINLLAVRWNLTILYKPYSVPPDIPCCSCIYNPIMNRICHQNMAAKKQLNQIWGNIVGSSTQCIYEQINKVSKVIAHEFQLIFLTSSFASMSTYSLLIFQIDYFFLLLAHGSTSLALTKLSHIISSINLESLSLLFKLKKTQQPEKIYWYSHYAS